MYACMYSCLYACVCMCDGDDFDDDDIDDDDDPVLNNIASCSCLTKGQGAACFAARSPLSGRRYYSIGAVASWLGRKIPGRRPYSLFWPRLLSAT